LGIRPEHLALGDVAVGSERIAIEGVVEVVEPLGVETIIEVICSGTSIVARVPGEELPRIGERIVLSADSRRFFVFDARSGERVTFLTSQT